MDSFYINIIILTELMMLAMVLHVLTYSGFKKSQKIWFILTFVDVMFCAAAEFAVHCGVYSADFSVILTIITVLQFSLAPLLGVLFVGALGIPHQKRMTPSHILRPSLRSHRPCRIQYIRRANQPLLRDRS